MDSWGYRSLGDWGYRNFGLGSSLGDWNFGWGSLGNWRRSLVDRTQIEGCFYYVLEFIRIYISITNNSIRSAKGVCQVHCELRLVISCSN